MEVHEKIKFLRLTKDWSQEEVAAKLEMSANGYGSIERGETDVNLSRLKQISKLYNLPISSLFDDGKNIFNFNGNAQYTSVNQHNQNNSEYVCTECLQLQAIKEQQAQEIAYLRGVVDSLLKKEN